MTTPKAIRVLVVYKRTTYERMKAQDAARADSLLHDSSDFASFMEEEDREHQRALAAVKQSLSALRAQASFQTREDVHEVSDWDLVITIGGDGTLLWASHLVGSHTPILAVNSSPQTSVGFFCGASADSVAQVLQDYVEGKAKRTTLQRMRVVVNDQCVSKRVLNDLLFSHIYPSLSARYRIEIDGHSEDQISSGIWIGPAAGSTAAIASAGGTALPALSKDIQYVVREPYHVRGPEYRLLKGVIKPGCQLALRCKIDRAILYIDGTQQVIDVAFGDRVSMDISNEPLSLVGPFSGAQ